MGSFTFKCWHSNGVLTSSPKSANLTATTLTNFDTDPKTKPSSSSFSSSSPLKSMTRLLKGWRSSGVLTSSPKSGNLTAAITTDSNTDPDTKPSSSSSSSPLKSTTRLHTITMGMRTIKLLFIRISRRYGKKTKFSRPLTTGEDKTKVLMDDSLRQREEGIQRAIAHCKRSLGACQMEEFSLREEEEDDVGDPVKVEEIVRLLEEAEENLDSEQLLIDGRERIILQQIKELRSANAIKDEEIKALRKLLFTETSQKLAELIVSSDPDTSFLGDKFRGDIAALLEENLDFWLRFSTSYHQIQMFDTKFKELDKDIIITDHLDISMEKKLREISSERALTRTLLSSLERNGLLQGELRNRYASLCNIHEEIAKLSDGKNLQFTTYQAARFQGEVVNMHQEASSGCREGFTENSPELVRDFAVERR